MTPQRARLRDRNLRGESHCNWSHSLMGRFNQTGGIRMQEHLPSKWLHCPPALRAEAYTSQMGTYNMATSCPELVMQIAGQKAYCNAPISLVSSHRRTALFRVAVQDEWQEIILNPRLLRWACIAHWEPAFCSKIHVPVQRGDMSEGLRNTCCGGVLRARSG